MAVSAPTEEGLAGQDGLTISYLWKGKRILTVSSVSALSYLRLASRQF